MEAKTTELVAVKQIVRLQEWSSQIEAQQSSGLSIRQWCMENRVNPKTYYYHLKTVREQSLNSSPAIVPLNVPQQNSDIRIEKNKLQRSRCWQTFHWKCCWFWYDRYVDRSASWSAVLTCNWLH